MNSRHSETGVQFKSQRIRTIDAGFYQQISVTQLNGEFDKSRRQVALSDCHRQNTKTRKNPGYEPHIAWKLVHSSGNANDFRFMSPLTAGFELPGEPETFPQATIRQDFAKNVHNHRHYSEHGQNQ